MSSVQFQLASSNPDAPYRVHFNEHREIPTALSELAQKLKNQPVFQGTFLIGKQCKLLPLENESDGAIFSIFESTLREQSKVDRWFVNNFCLMSSCIADANGEIIPHGVYYWNSEVIDPEMSDTSEKTYAIILEKFTVGWKIENHTKFMGIKAPIPFKECTFLTKKSSINDEDKLINHLAKKFGMEKAVFSDRLCAFQGKGLQGNEIYLLVRKSSIAKFFAKFGIRVEK